jgi:hypothetical protein
MAPTLENIRMITIEQARALIGKPVRITDDTPEPPKHHTAKLRRWRYRNYTGTLRQVQSLFIVVVRPGIYGTSDTSLTQLKYLRAIEQ